MPKKQVTALIDEQIFEKINRLAKTDDCSVARIVRKIISGWYEKGESNGKGKSI